ncbi:MAG TPA: DUF5686 family protein, partial [Bacteroidota bacterium]
VIRRDTAIAVITESYSTCYWQRGDTLREVIKQKRQTENMKGAQNVASVGGILNFYDDDIRLAGFSFIGPTSPKAFDYYDFKLLRTRVRTGSDIYDIKMIPTTRLVPLFEGTISIAGGSYAVAGVNVTPNEAFVIPFVSEINLSYAQQFSLFEDQYWMPVDIRIKGFLKVGITGLTLPGIGIESVSSIYDCKVNPELPDSIFKRSRRLVLKEAEVYDSTYWAQREVLPLTQEEKSAYRQLDSSQTLEKQFEPSGPLVTLGDLASVSPASPQIRFNRVEGLFLGASANIDSVAGRLGAYGSLGYGFSDRRYKGRIGLKMFVDADRNYSFGMETYRDINHFLTGDIYDNTNNLFAALLYKIDYFDYYYVDGFTLSVGAKPAHGYDLELGWRNEDQRSASRNTNFSLFAQHRTYASNPSIAQGVLRELFLNARYGEEPFPIPIIPRNYVQLNVYHSAKGLGSSFDYTQLMLKGEYHFAAYLRSLFLPPSLALMLSSGTSVGSLPPQRYFHIDSPLIGYAPSNVLRGAKLKEFSGDTYVIVSVEHNFRNVPFLWLNIPFLYRNSIEFVTFVNCAQAWAIRSPVPPDIHPTKGIYAEAGCGISRIFGLLRVDVTYRLIAPERLTVTAGLAMLL